MEPIIKTSITFFGASLMGTAFASLNPTRPEALDARQLLIVPSKITSQSHLESTVAGFESDGASLVENGKVLMEILEAIVPSLAPASLEHSAPGKKL